MNRYLRRIINWFVVGFALAIMIGGCFYMVWGIRGATDPKVAYAIAIAGGAVLLSIGMWIYQGKVAEIRLNKVKKEIIEEIRKLRRRL